MELPQLGRFVLCSVETNIVTICRSRGIILAHSGFSLTFGLNITRGRKSKAFSGEFSKSISCSLWLKFDFIYQNWMANYVKRMHQATATSTVAFWILSSIFMFNIGRLKCLYRQSQYSKQWVGKCHIPVAQWLEHSACKRGGAIFHCIKFRLFQEQQFTVKMGTVARTRLAFRMLTFKKT